MNNQQSELIEKLNNWVKQFIDPVWETLLNYCEQTTAHEFKTSFEYVGLEVPKVIEEIFLDQEDFERILYFPIQDVYVSHLISKVSYGDYHRQFNIVTPTQVTTTVYEKVK